MKENIIFRTPEDARNFVVGCHKIHTDVNLYLGHQVFDGKSIMGVLSIGCGQKLVAEIITDDEEELYQFKELVKGILA